MMSTPKLPHTTSSDRSTKGTTALAASTSRAPGRGMLLDTISHTWRTGEADRVWVSLAVTVKVPVALRRCWNLESMNRRCCCSHFGPY